jgi:hypothetical protein
VDTLICADSHDELVRRSSPLLCFLVSQGPLSHGHLDRLWLSSLSDNSHTAKINSDLLLELAAMLNMDNVCHYPPHPFSVIVLTLLIGHSYDMCIDVLKNSLYHHTTLI